MCGGHAIAPRLDDGDADVGFGSGRVTIVHR